MSPEERFEQSASWARHFARRYPRKAATKMLTYHLAHAYTSEAARGAAEGILEGLREASRCARCGRALTDSTSVARGIGPDCFANLGPLDLSALTNDQIQLPPTRAAETMKGWPA